MGFPMKYEINITSMMAYDRKYNVASNQYIKYHESRATNIRLDQWAYLKIPCPWCHVKKKKREK